MVTRTRTIDAPAAKVWEILSDGWLYALWMVGATATREVDTAWPRVGSTVHHLTGAWPLAAAQTTSVVECEPEHKLGLDIHAQFIGDTRVDVSLRPNSEGTEARLERTVVRGLRQAVPQLLSAPLLNAWADDCLLRLSFLAERRR